MKINFTGRYKINTHIINNPLMTVWVKIIFADFLETF